MAFVALRLARAGVVVMVVGVSAMLPVVWVVWLVEL